MKRQLRVFTRGMGASGAAPRTPRTALALRAAPRRWAAWSALACALACGVACSSQQRPEGKGMEIETPLGVATAPAAKDVAKVEGSPGAPLSLEAFLPILLEERFASVQQALTDGESQLALDRYREALGTSPDREGELYLLQLGLLELGAEHHDAAIASFARVAAARGELGDYASYLAGRTALERGDARAALVHLSRVPALPVPAALHRGEAQLLLGERERAATELRGFLASGDAPNGWVRASMLLATLLSETGVVGPTPNDAERLEALRAVRRVAIRTADSKSARDASALEAKILGGLSAEVFERERKLSAEDQLVRLQGLTDARSWDDAVIAGDELLGSAPRAEAYSKTLCEARLLRNKALAGKGQWGQAVDGINDLLRHCRDPDLRARALFLLGRYATSDKRHAQAIRAYAELEREAPEHRLADDARLLGANAYLALQDHSRYTEMLTDIAEDYPSGDVSLDGTFELALRRIEKGDWSGAANVLERGMQVAERADLGRDHETACRERYYRARAWIELGEMERGLAQYREIIARCPLAYYMQQAYTRLHAADPQAAERTLAEVADATQREPFGFAWRAEFDTPAFKRALGLMRVGQVEWAGLELESLGVGGEDTSPELLWALALLYERAGSPYLSQQLTRGRLTDWLRRWPVGDWRKAWEIAFPRPHYAIVQREAQHNELSEALIYGIMREESMFDPNAHSHADAYGLMQLIEPTAKHFAKELRMPYRRAALFRPAVNIKLGSRVLRSYSDRFPENPLLGIPSYNAGPGRPKRWKSERPNVDFDVWVELIPFRETRRYTKRVLASRGVYSVLYGPGDADLKLPLRL